MRFWGFMMVMCVLIPITMIVVGKLFVKKCPPRHPSGRKEFGVAYGYRTPMSVKSDETWAFAHAHSGKIWVPTGWVMLAASVASMFLVFGGTIDHIGTFGTIIVMVQCVVMVGTMIPTERALKKNFDKNGKRRYE